MVKTEIKYWDGEIEVINNKLPIIKDGYVLFTWKDHVKYIPFSSIIEINVYLEKDRKSEKRMQGGVDQ